MVEWGGMFTSTWIVSLHIEHEIHLGLIFYTHRTRGWRLVCTGILRTSVARPSIHGACPEIHVKSRPSDVHSTTSYVLTLTSFDAIEATRLENVLPIHIHAVYCQDLLTFTI